MRYLLDTDVCIYLIKKRPKNVLEKFRLHPPADVALSVISLFELEYGVAKSNQPQRAGKALAKFVSPLNILGMDRAAAAEAAALRAGLEGKGMPIGPYDILIAGIAKSRSMTLVTNNTREFGRIQGLSLENWVQE